MHDSPARHDPTVWWHVYPLGALGVPVREPHDGAVVHRLPRLHAWLDHAAALGATGLQLGPVHTSASHGYDVLDHRAVDPRLGDEADLVALVDAAHARGMRVMLDGVFNHVGADHPWHRQALADGPGSPAARLFRIDWTDPAHPRSACFEGHQSLVLLDHDAPEVADLVVEAMGHWLRLGVDGWRLDAAYAVDPGFWARVLPRVRAEFPDVVVVGEVIHGDYPDVVARSGMDGVTQYELWKATWSAIADRNLFELAHALERHDGFVRAFRPMTFVGNHDVSRIAEVVGDAGAAVALAVLATVGGDPSVYYGDEHAFRGRKEERWGGDDAVRPALPATPDDLAPDGRWLAERHAELLGLRREHPWLADARTTVLELTNERMVYTSAPPDGWRAPGGGSPSPSARVVVTLDLTGTPRADVTSHP